MRHGQPPWSKEDWGDLDAAVADLVAGRTVSIEQKPCPGCNNKWKPGNEPGNWG